MRRALASLVLVVGCAAPPLAPPSLPTTDPGLGISGMAPLGDGAYLVVHDAKTFEDGPRLSRLTVGPSGVAYRPLAVADWRHADGRASDLEGACALGGGEFLVVESGTFEGRFGRLFHLRVGADAAEVLAVDRVPVAVDTTPATVGDNVEGLACVRDGDDLLVLFGERGGSAAYPTGLVRWSRFDPVTGTLDWTDAGRAGVPVSAPGDLVARGFRSITGLHVAPDGALWAAASRDPGDLGPYDSVVWRVGRVAPGAPVPIAVEGGGPACGVAGFKVEAVSAPALRGTLSLGTEDEAFGGAWRPLRCEEGPARGRP